MRIGPIQQCFHWELHSGIFLLENINIFLRTYISTQIIFNAIDYQVKIKTIRYPFKSCASFGYLYLLDPPFSPAHYFHASQNNFLIKFPITIETAKHLKSYISKCLSVNIREHTHLNNYNITAVELSNLVFYTYSTR